MTPASPPGRPCPRSLAAGSLLVALVGMYWDISLHIDDGRDAGPLANPAHYLILFGLFGIFAAGFLAIVLPEGRPSRGAVRISGDWYAPLGGIAMMASSAFALIGFPLDDVWHRIFGQDVTLWGPTHLMLIGGAGLTLIGSCILIVEGRLPAGKRRSWRTMLARGRRTFAFGGLLIGLSTFQAEFDFGVPQFNLVLEPMMLAFAAGVALVGARLWIGRGAAIGAVLFFIVIRGGVALLVGPVLGETTPHLPLYLVEAACVELVVLAIPARRPYAFGAVAGGLIGTVGFAAEYAWSHIWMPVPWPENLIADAWLPVLVTACRRRAHRRLPGERPGLGRARQGPDAREHARAHALDPAGRRRAGRDRARRRAQRRRLAGRRRARRGDAERGQPEPGAHRSTPRSGSTQRPQPTMRGWVSMIAWQGGEKLHLEHLEESAPGVYETNEPLPVDGTWKALVRLHSGDSLLGLPIYLPEDPAIPAEGVPATRELRSRLCRRDRDPPARAQGRRPRLPGADRLPHGRLDRARAGRAAGLGPAAARRRGRRAAPPRPGQGARRRRPRGDRMSALLVAHAGHWLTTIGFALAPLTVIGGVVALAIAERRRSG